MKIALTGKMRSGKDTLAQYAIDTYGFKKYAFGEGIKEAAKFIFPDSMMKSKPRRLYQVLGQQMRQFDEDVWVNKCFDKISADAEERSKLLLSKIFPIITDLRQPNEYERCVEEGFAIIKVVADDEIRLERMNSAGDSFTEEDLHHETESHIDSFVADYTIYNEGNIKDLEKQFDQKMNLDLK